MPAEYFYSPHPFRKEQAISLEEREHHHLSRVLRIGQNEQVSLINGKGEFAQAVVEEMRKDRTTLRIIDVKQDPPPPPLGLAIAQIQESRLEFLVEKGTELGVTSFYVFPGEKSKKKGFSPTQTRRWESLRIAAMKQCGSLYLPEWKECPPLREWETIPSPSFFGSLDPSAPLFWEILEKESKKDSPLFFIGPESGFSLNEVSLLKERGAQGVRLHRSILRSETAGLVAAALISHWRG